MIISWIPWEVWLHSFIMPDSFLFFLLREDTQNASFLGTRKSQLNCITDEDALISMLWEILWGALHVCRSKMSDVENLFHIRHIFESPQPWGCSWRGYATQEADQELKWKLRTNSVWENSVLEFLGSHSWNTSLHLIGLKRPA